MGTPSTRRPESGENSTGANADKVGKREGSARKQEVPRPHISDFTKFTSQPSFAKAGTKIETACSTAEGGPTMQPSSKYHRFHHKPHVGREEIARWIPRQNKMGPSGSPCWVPRLLGIENSPSNKGVS